eukprot:8613404-Alexandrium_andersonii.AAC.1
MHFLRSYVTPAELRKEQGEAIDLARALFAAGASHETRATLAEVFSPPRVTAQAERRPGLGVLQVGARRRELGL